MKKFRFAWWRLQHWPLLVLAGITLVQAIKSSLNPGVELVPLWLRLVVVAGGLIMVGILVWGFGKFFFNYLQLSVEGIGERRWPGKLKLVPWDKVENVHHYATLGIFKSDILVYKETRQISGVETKEVLNFFTLSDFRGWPKGELTDELRKYYPQAFR